MIYKNKNGEVLHVELSSRKGKFVIPSRIANYKCSEIEPEDFIDCAELTYVKVPEGVTFIGDSAFYRCSSLTNIEIPESVDSI